MRIPIATDFKTRTGAPDKDARLKNSYVETKGDPNAPETAVRKRPAAQGGVSVSTGTAQGGIGFYIGSTPYFIGFWGDTLVNYVGNGTNWNSGTTYPQGSMVSYGFVNYWSIVGANTNNTPSISSSFWSTSPTYYTPPVVYTPTTWTASSLPNNSYWWSIAYGNGVYVVVDIVNFQFATSTNKTTWSLRTTNGFKTVCFGNGKFVAVDGSWGYTSTNGITWSGVYSPNIVQAEYMAYGNGLYCCVNTSGSMPSMASADGITWSKGVNGSIPAMTCLASNGSNFVSASGNKVYLSTNGLTWSFVTVTGMTQINGIAWNGSTYCAIGGGKCAISANGSSWTVYSLPALMTNGGKITANTSGCFMALNATYTSPSDVFATSSDGITWVTGTMPTNSKWESIVSNGTDFVAITSDFASLTNKAASTP